MPTLDEQVKAAWSEVLNQYQRRADLIPNLVETVKGYAKQEQQVLTQVVEARAKATQMQLPPDILSNPEKFHEFEQNQGALTGALGRLLVVAEKYPDLKSNQNFLALQSQLEGTENRIAVARRDYIIAVQAYNTELRTFLTDRSVDRLSRHESSRDVHNQRSSQAGADGKILMRHATIGERAQASWLMLAMFMLLASTGFAAEPKFPELTGRVVDDAGILDASTTSQLTDMLAHHEQTTGQQVVVVTLPSLQGYPIEDSAIS